MRISTTALPKTRPAILAVALLLACSGEAGRTSNHGSGGTSGSGGSSGVGGGASGGSSTGTGGGGAGGATTGAGGTAAGSGGTAGNAGTTGGTTTDAGGAPSDGDPDASCMAFCASGAVMCFGPDTEAASASTTADVTASGCSLTATLPVSGTLEVTIDCNSKQACIEQGSGCLGSAGECYPIQVGEALSYFVPGCLHGSLSCVFD